MFQVTVAPLHPIKQAPLEAIVKNILKGSKRDLRLFFVVPGDIYDDFSFQNYVTNEGKISKAVPSIITKQVKQCALKFNLEAAQNGGSPGIRTIAKD